VVAAALRMSMIETIVEPSALINRMETARVRIEERFLEGGASLLSILDILNKLVASLDQVTNSLDEGTANATITELQATIARLSKLSDIEASRRAQFQDIAAVERNLRPHIDDMLETLRYLRTFAVTAKITGASIPDFSGFAEEILQRIQDGTRQVNEFGVRSKSLGRGLAEVMSKGEAIIDNFDRTIPQIVSELADGGVAIDKHRRALSERATSVAGVARTIQGKLSTTLSAMQIGDITRQRIEHCQSALTIGEQYLASPEAGALSAVQKDEVAAVIRELVSAQLREIVADFDRDTGKIVTNVASFRADLRSIEAVRAAMNDGSGDQAGSNGGAVRLLENGVASARDAVRDVEAVARESRDLGRVTGRTVAELVEGIGMIQLVRTDIHYMALNTNLRCNRVGDEGRAINVVTAELRQFAARLDETSEKALDELKALESASGQLDQIDEDGNSGSLYERMERAVQNIRGVGDRMESQMAALGDQSRDAVQGIEASLSKLDFQAELGDVLRDCAQSIADKPGRPAVAGVDNALAVIGPLIAKTYTMVSERQVHASIFGDTVAAEPAPALSLVMNDDDIDDALF
jgi:hypothetical protein